MRKFVLMILLIPLVHLAEVVIYVVSEPFVNVYVNGDLVGQTDIFGYFKLTFQSTNVSFSISVGGPYYYQLGNPSTIVLPDGTRAIYIPVVPAGYLRIFSNSYPVKVFYNNEYMGEVDSVEDTLKVPAVSGQFVLTSPGMEPIKREISIPWKETKVIAVEFEEKPLSLKLIPSYSEFSPNGDWYRDTVRFHVYLSRPEKVVLEIYGRSGLVRKFEIQGEEGDNVVEWDGKDENGVDLPDGTYKVVAKVGNLKSETSIVLSRKEYTYTKEIVISSFLVMLLLIGIGLYLSYGG